LVLRNSLGLEGASRGQLVQTPAQGTSNKSRLLRNLSSWWRNGDCSASLGNLFHCL